MLTAIRCRLTPCACQLLACWQAVRKTHSPIGIIKPVSSASGMKSTGDTDPSSGLCQRNNASTPLICPLGKSSCGW